MKFFLCVFGLLTVDAAQNTQIYKLCVLPKDYEKCADLSRGGSQVQCVKALDSVDCALKLEKKEADFATFGPEQSHLIASSSINNDVVVLAESRASLYETKNNSFQTVVVVKKTYNGGFDGLRGLKYCHPGFEYHTLWTPRGRKEFENVLFKNELYKNCRLNTSQTYLEHELKTISEFFGESCRPGPWTDDTKTEDELKKKYGNLCALCDNINECSYNNPKEDRSLNCLIEKRADIAYTTLYTLTQLTSFKYQDYKLLCRNGEFAPITNDIKPECAWRNQPWTLIAARRDIADTLKYYFKTWIDPKYLAATQIGAPFSVKLPWQTVLADILTEKLAYRLNILEEIPPSIKLFLGKNNQLVETTVKDCPMRWCTVSQKEEQKCTWVSKASLIAGVEPQISCIPGANVYDCLMKIRKNNADIIAIDSNYGYLARKLGLNNVLYNENSPDDIASIVAVIPPDSTIKKFKDFKGKRACFPEYRGLSWVSFIDQARRLRLIKDNCEFGKTVSEFFDGVCAPGAKDDQHYRQRNEEYPKLCSVCSDNCESNTENEFYDNKGALSCLLKKLADVAFVEVEALANLTILQDFLVVCNDDTTVSLEAVKNNPELNCFMSKTVNSEIVTRHNDTRKVEYKQALLLMDQLFGSSFTSQHSISLFKVFDGEQNLMFKDNVLGFDDDSSENPYVQRYIEIFKKIDDCNASWMLSVSLLTIAISSLASLLL